MSTLLDRIHARRLDHIVELADHAAHRASLAHAALHGETPEARRQAKAELLGHGKPLPEPPKEA